MATKSDFTADEWKALLESPLLAGFAITAADPIGFFTTIREGWAEAKELAAAKTTASDELIKAVAEDLLTSEGRTAARSRRRHSDQRTKGQGARRIEARGGDRRRQGAGRRRSLQDLARAHRPARRGSRGERIPGLWRRPGQRQRKGDARRDSWRAGRLTPIFPSLSRRRSTSRRRRRFGGALLA